MKNLIIALILISGFSAFGQDSVVTKIRIDGREFNLVGGIPDGDKGDITVSLSGTVWSIDAAVVTGAMIQNGTITALDITNGVVDNSKLSTMPALTIKGNNTGGVASPSDLTATQVRTLLNVEDGATVDQTNSLSGVGNKDVTISGTGGNTIDLTLVDGIDPKNFVSDGSARTNAGEITNFYEQSRADYTTDGAPSTGERAIIKNPLGMTESASGTTFDFVDADGYLIDNHLWIDNTTADNVGFTVADMEAGYMFEIYLNQATEPTFNVTVEMETDGLDWTTDSLANTDVTLFVRRNGMGTYEGTYKKGH